MIGSVNLADWAHCISPSRWGIFDKRASNCVWPSVEPLHHTSLVGWLGVSCRGTPFVGEGGWNARDACLSKGRIEESLLEVSVLRWLDLNHSGMVDAIPNSFGVVWSCYAKEKGSNKQRREVVYSLPSPRPLPLHCNATFSFPSPSTTSLLHSSPSPVILRSACV